jgi:hypothetical protein
MTYGTLIQIVHLNSKYYRLIGTSHDETLIQILHSFAMGLENPVRAIDCYNSWTLAEWEVDIRQDYNEIGRETLFGLWEKWNSHLNHAIEQ